MWRNDKMCGKGSLFYPSGDLLYNGDFIDGFFNSFGVLYNAKIAN